jgi:nitrogen fixation protein NifB
MNFDHHPCFNPDACQSFGRVHLPVAPRCNIQCKFCNRQFDCVNETRPGVTSAVLSPAQAMVYLEEVFARKGNISVVGIAGPGDPFANPRETLETLARVRTRFPEVMLCVATNGLNLTPYIDELERLQVSHVTVTVNAVDPAIGARIYAWMRVGKRVVRAEEGARILLERQLEAIQGLKAHRIVVKVNSIILPGINEDHIEAVARRMAALDVDLFNAMPYFPNAGSDFEQLEEPDKATVGAIREEAARHVKQMRHCTRCRADAVGLLGEAPDEALMHTLTACRRLEQASGHLKLRIFGRDQGEAEARTADIRPYGEDSRRGLNAETGRKDHFETASKPRTGRVSPRPNVAVASMEGVLVNQHLGEAERLLVYGEKDGRIQLLDARATPPAGGGLKRWQAMAASFADCSTLLVSGVGANPLKTLTASGIEVLEIEGLIEEALRAVFAGESLNHMVKRSLTACGAACSGNGAGCG